MKDMQTNQGKKHMSFRATSLVGKTTINSYC
jgi:hypothetical protein